MRKLNSLELALEIFLTISVGLLLFCGQLALFSVWKLIEKMENNSFFTNASLIWINRLVSITRSAAIIPIILFLALIWQADDPGFFVLLAAIELFLVSFHLVIDLLRNQIKSRIIS